MKLTTLHQVLIGGAIGLGAIYAFRSAVMYARNGQVFELASGTVGVALALAGLFYLRHFRRKLGTAQLGSPAGETE